METWHKRQNWFDRSALLTLTGSFVVDRFIGLFRTTTKKWNLFCDHHRINGRRHICLVHIVVHVNKYEARPARQLWLLWDLKSCHTLPSRHDFSYVPLRASGLLDAGTKDERGGYFLNTVSFVLSLFLLHVFSFLSFSFDSFTLSTLFALICLLSPPCPFCLCVFWCRETAEPGKRRWSWGWSCATMASCITVQHFLLLRISPEKKKIWSCCSQTVDSFLSLSS